MSTFSDRLSRATSVAYVSSIQSLLQVPDLRRNGVRPAGERAQHRASTDPRLPLTPDRLHVRRPGDAARPQGRQVQTLVVQARDASGTLYE
jgi:hypothetical protein